MIWKKFFPELTAEEDKNLTKLANREYMWSLLWENMTGQAKGLVFTLSEFIEEMYKDDPEEKHAAYERQFKYFNTNPNLGGFIVGLVYAMELKRSKDKESMPAELISDIRISLCGPFAGVGDALFQSVLKVVFAGLTMTMTANGNPLGPVLFFVLFGLVQRGTMDYLTYLGYSAGTSVIDKLFESGIMASATKAISVLGLLMTGAMTASVVGFGFNWVIPLGDASLNVQQTLDSIFPGLMALVLTFGISYLLKKNIKVTTIVWSVLGLCILMGFLGMV
ncbi:MAG: PTS system mannose/fructose/sorbose family transporter subunit IID [Erysipelotrichaceae bacterium]|nr:PTS system mannose/fructose/sorbose family transporter subunit IID [Erysipelotrichaceae bacterium]